MVYPGIDLIYYGNDRRLEYGFLCDRRRVPIPNLDRNGRSKVPTKWGSIHKAISVIIGGKCGSVGPGFSIGTAMASSPRRYSSSYVLEPPTAKSSALKTHRVRFEVAAHVSLLPLDH